MEARKISGLFNSSTTKKNLSTALKPPIEVTDIDSYLSTITTTDNGEIIVGLESGTLYVFDDATGELKHKIAQTDFQKNAYDSDDDYEESVRKERNFYYTHQLRHVIPYQQNTLLTANNQEMRVLNRETGEQLQSFASYSGERICSLLETNDGNIFSAACPPNLLRLTDGKTGAVIWEHSATPILFYNSLMNSCSAALSNHEQLQSYFALLASYLFSLEKTDNVFSAIKCANGDIACGTTGGAIFILDAETGQYKNVFRAYEGEKKVPQGRFEMFTYECSKSINVLAALPNNDIVSGAQNGPLYIWDHQTGLPKHRLVTDDCDNFRVTDIKIYNDLIISKSSYGPSICIWDSNTGKCLKTMTGLFAHEIAVTKGGDLVFNRGLSGSEIYSIHRLPISYILQHELKSIPLDKISFPEPEVRESNRKTM